MSALMENAMPSALQKVVQKISGFRLNHAKLLCESADSCSANGTIRVRLPTNGIIDLSGLLMHVTNTITETTDYAQSPCLEQYISRIELTGGSEPIMSISNYADLFAVLSNASMSDAHQRTRYAMNTPGATGGYGIGAKPKYVLVDEDYLDGDNVHETSADQSVSGIISGNLTEGAPNTLTDTALGSIVKREFYGSCKGAQYCVASTFLGLHDLGFIDCSLFPQLQLEIQMLGDNILAGDTPDASWAWTNIHFTIPVLQFPQYSNALYQMIAPNPETGLGSEIYYKFKRYVNTQFDKTSNTQYDLKFSTASSSVDKVWMTVKNNGYDTQGSVDDATWGHGLKFFRYSGYTTRNTNKLTYAQLFIDEKSYPSYRIEVDRFAAVENMRALSQHNNNQHDCRFESSEEFYRQKFFLVWNFEDLSSPNGVSGLNTLGLSSGFRIHLESNAALATGGSFYVFVESSAVLAVSAGRQLRLEQ